MEIMENLWQVGGAEYTSVEDAAIYLIRFGEKAALIDAGCGGAAKNLASNIAKVLAPEVNIEYLRAVAQIEFYLLTPAHLVRLISGFFFLQDFYKRTNSN